MTKHFTPPNLQKYVCYKGSAVLVMVIVLAIVSSMIGLSVAKIGHASMNATASNTIAMQASNIASSDAALLHAVNYEDLAASNRSAVSGTAFQHETLLSNESSYTDTIKQKIATINVYKGDESIPRTTLQVTRYSVEKQEASGVPIGTVIAWAGSKAPSTNGTWLECNGQSCAAYPALIAVLGKSTVPDYRGRFLETDTTPGTVKEAGLPNIEGKFIGYDNGTFSPDPTGFGLECSGSFLKVRENWIHAFSNVKVLTFNPTGSLVGDLNAMKSVARSAGVRDWAGEAESEYYFSASRSSSIYGSSTTVQPASVTVRRFIKAA